MAKAKFDVKTMKLDELLRIKNDLEANIKQAEFLMRKNNSKPKDEELQIDYTETMEKYMIMLDQLVLLKEAIRDGNSKAGDDGLTNDHNIYLLSNFNRRKAFLNSLNTFEGSRTTLKSAGKQIDFKANITFKEVSKELTAIESEIRKLETTLSNFNHATEVTVKLIPELELA